MRKKLAKHFTVLLFISFLPFYNINAQNKNDSLARLVKTLEDKIAEIEKNRGLTKINLKSPYVENSKRKVNVVLYEFGNISRKLEFDGLDESFKYGGKDIYYFDEQGKLFAHDGLIGDMKVHNLYIGKTLLIYTKSGKNYSDSQLDDTEMSNFIFASTKYVVDYYMNNFPEAKYETFNIAKNTSYVLKLVSNTEIHSAPSFSASVVKRLSKGTALFYIDRSMNRDSISGKERWMWLKVKDKSNSVGWIWGHSSVVVQY